MVMMNHAKERNHSDEDLEIRFFSSLRRMAFITLIDAYSSMQDIYYLSDIRFD